MPSFDCRICARKRVTFCFDRRLACARLRGVLKRNFDLFLGLVRHGTLDYRHFNGCRECCVSLFCACSRTTSCASSASGHLRVFALQRPELDVSSKLPKFRLELVGRINCYPLRSVKCCCEERSDALSVSNSRERSAQNRRMAWGSAAKIVMFFRF